MVGVEADLMHAGAVAIHDMQKKDELLAIVGYRLVLRSPFVEQNRLGRELPGRGEHDPSVR